MGYMPFFYSGQSVSHTPDVDINFGVGTAHPFDAQPTLEVGARYKIHRPVILLLMSGRSLEPARPNQSYFVGYFGLQFLLPAKSCEDSPDRVISRCRVGTGKSRPHL